MMDDLSKWFISGGRAVHSTAPTGAIVPEPLENGVYLPCDGRALRNEDYPELFTIIGTHYGWVKGKFYLPDLRVHGKFYIRVK